MLDEKLVVWETDGGLLAARFRFPSWEEIWLGVYEGVLPEREADRLWKRRDRLRCSAVGAGGGCMDAIAGGSAEEWLVRLVL